MNKPIELRFIPKWLSGVITHYNADYKDFESIVSKHDVDLYRLSNSLLRAAFSRLGIRDFTFPDAEMGVQYSEEDVLFALFGNNPSNQKVGDFALTHFSIVPDRYDGVILIEKEHGDSNMNLVCELLKAVALYRGKDVAYESDSFKQFLIRIDTSVGSSHAVDQSEVPALQTE